MSLLSLPLAILLPVTVVLSAFACGVFLRLAQRWQFTATPNARSSHQRPTPHGGGVPLILIFALGVVAAAVMLPEGSRWLARYGLPTASAVLLMVVGVLDDRRGLSVRIRLAVYAAVCVVNTAVVVSAAAVHGEFSTLVWWVLGLGAAFGSLWCMNLFNFMDGIDGIAALQTVFVCVAAAVLSGASAGGMAAPFVTPLLLLAAAHLGFLCFNWPPARLFMGDAGSVPTGFLLAVFALIGSLNDYLSIASWLILMAVFLADATGTLLWRMATGQRFTEAHRLHAYQCFSRSLGSHLRVDMLVLLINVLWLFPLALVAQVWHQWQVILVILAYVPLVLGMAKVPRLA